MTLAATMDSTRLHGLSPVSDNCNTRRMSAKVRPSDLADLMNPSRSTDSLVVWVAVVKIWDVRMVVHPRLMAVPMSVA